jgi:hypothetical protein
LKSSVVFKGKQCKRKPARHFLRKFLNHLSMNFSAMLAIAVVFCGIWGLVSKNYPVVQEKV